MGEDLEQDSNPAESPNWHVLTVEETLAKIATSKDGLNESEALRRAAEVGPNKLDEESPTHWIWRLIDQYRDPMVYLLLAAAAIAFLFEPEDKGTPIFIIIALSLNGIFGAEVCSLFLSRRARRDVRVATEWTQEIYRR